MTHPALEDMDYDQLTALIDQATKLRASKFENHKPEDKLLQSKANIERKADPFRSPTA